MSSISRIMAATVVAMAVGMYSPGIVQASPGHTGPHGSTSPEMLENMRKMHRGHKHGHDFKAMEEMSSEQGKRLMKLMREVGLALPPMDSHRGHLLFIDKGCIVCHAVNSVGGDVGPALNASDMPSPMNVFEFAARMWKGAPAMVAMQEEELGDVIELTGQDLADLIAFVHDDMMQKTVAIDQVPKRWRKKLAR